MVASLSSIAATISPFSAVGCCRTTTQSPSQIAASIIESPTTRRRKSVPSPTICREAEDVLDDFFGHDRSTSRDPAEHRTYDASGPRRRCRSCRPEVRHVGIAPVSTSAGRLIRGDHLHGTWAMRIAAEVALLPGAISRWDTELGDTRPTDSPISRMLGIAPDVDRGPGCTRGHAALADGESVGTITFGRGPIAACSAGVSPARGHHCAGRPGPRFTLSAWSCQAHLSSTGASP